MANQIKLKNGSGSDPSASDLVVGEVALRTDNASLFTKKDDGTVAEIGAAAGVSDGDKGDITVSNSGATFTIDNDAVTYAKIQNVSATNRILGRDSSGAGVIEEITPANLRTMLNVADGATNVTNTNQLTNGAGFITATLTNEQVQDIVGGMVTGNTETGITVTYQDGDGTLDFVVGTLNQDTTGNAATATEATNVTAVANNTTNTAYRVPFLTAATGTSQLQTDNNNGMSYNPSNGNLTATSFNGSGASITNLNASSLSSGTIPAARLSASDILTKIKTVDGAGSGLDADTLDGISSASFLRSDADDTMSAKLTISRAGHEKLVLSGSADPYILFQEGTTNKAYIQWDSDGYVAIANSESSESLRVGSGTSGLKFVEGGNVRNVFHTGNLAVGDSGLTENNFTDALKNKLDGIAAGATNVTNNNQLTNGAGYITSGAATSFPSGTRMLFQQTSAPTGWTKDTSDTNNRALRVVSGSAGSGGSVAFTTAFASKSVSGSIANATAGGSIGNTSAGGTVSNHTLSTSQIPAHNHSMTQRNAGLGCGPNIPQAGIPGTFGCNTNSTSFSTNNTGGGGSHNHGFSGSAHNHSFSGSAHNHSFSGTAINLAVQYLDVIIASKN